MSYEYILLENEGGIATITLNRPDRLNALLPAMRLEIRNALEKVDADDSVRVVILTGAGRGFCAGADVGTITSRGIDMADDEPKRALLLKPVSSQRLLATIGELNKPTICAINGVVAGAGMVLALACDIIIASEQARYRVAFTRMGIPPGDGLSFKFTRRIGTHRALELAYTNRLVEAAEMERIGLVNKVVPQDELMKSAREMAKSMFQIPPLTLALAKQCIYRGDSGIDLESQLAFTNLAAKTMEGTEDQIEAQKSFVEKREPKYKGK